MQDFRFLQLLQCSISHLVGSMADDTSYRTPSPDFTYSMPAPDQIPEMSPQLWCLVPIWSLPPLGHTGVHPAVLGQHMRPHLPVLPAALAQSVENYVDWLLELLVLPPTNRQMPAVLASWQASLRQLCQGYRLTWRQTFVVYALDFVPYRVF